MTRIHKLGKYRDGLLLIEYCKVCSAEGLELQDDCPGNFGDKNKKSLDEVNQAANKELLKTAE